jgi:hypothetical protein
MYIKYGIAFKGTEPVEVLALWDEVGTRLKLPANKLG